MIQMSDVLVGDIMIKNVRTVGPEDKIALARRKMLRHGVGGLPVVKEDNTLMGIITLRDISFTGTMGDIMTLAVKDLMTKNNLLTCSRDTSLTEIADIMIKTGIQRLPIVDNNGKLMGLVTQSVLIRAFRALFK
ncbi:MAG: CBS domain-containing protein [Candidatus Bathyarchaeota archaeon]|jgi:IMP dehydrogenase|nr:MAG: CBS domain-containing protein [Candidatus Bathyarchaeota archaeon]